MTDLRVGLVSTAALGVPGSMRAYAGVLEHALALHAPEIAVRTFELDPNPPRGGLAQRLDMLALPFRARRCRGEDVDLWHVLDGSRAYVATGFGRRPVVITAHDIIPVLQQRGRFPGAPRVSRAAGWLWQRNGAAMRQAQALICVSESTRRDVEKTYSAGHRARVVPLPVRPELAALAMQLADGPRAGGVVLHVGNNAFYKQREQALRIFARLDRDLARQLVMIGPAPTNLLLSLSDQLGIAASVVWIQDADDAVLADWYGRATVMVFPSLYEGFGWPVLEAMTFGLPVVASTGGSLPEVVAAAAPCLAPDDLAGFVGEVEALLRDPQLHARRSQAARLRSRSFGMERFARETSAAYRAAMEART